MVAASRAADRGALVLARGIRRLGEERLGGVVPRRVEAGDRLSRDPGGAVHVVLGRAKGEPGPPVASHRDPAEEGRALVDVLTTCATCVPVAEVRHRASLTTWRAHVLGSSVEGRVGGLARVDGPRLRGTGPASWRR